MFAEFDWIEATRNSPIMVALIGCSVVTLAAVFERALYYRRRSSDAHRFLADVLKSVRAGKVDEARWACKQATHPAAAAMLSVLERMGQSLAAVEEGLQITLSEQKLRLERNLTVIGSMAAVAPLVGLLGTVWGIMRAFHDMAATGSASPSVVAAGVAEALLTTAAGLVIAVPAVLLYNHFSRRMSVMLITAENQARALRDTLVQGDGWMNVDDSEKTQLEKIGSILEKKETPTPVASRV